MDPRIKNMFITSLLVLLIILLNVLVILKKMLNPFYRFFFARKQPLFLRTPEDRFTGIENLGYKFKSRYLDLPLGSSAGKKQPRMHYIDESPHSNIPQKGIILCLHGEPTWSFLYRNMVPSLVQAGYRVVAPDFIGFGKSDKYSDKTNYTHEMHLFCLKHLMDTLNLKSGVTLVCQDWGGLIGLSVVKDLPDYFSEIVVMNTGIPNGNNRSKLFFQPLKTLQTFVPFLLWRSCVQLLENNIPVEMMMSRIMKYPASISKAYNAPFPNSNYKAGVAQWPLLVPLMADDPVAYHMNEVETFLPTWKKPALIMFGDGDPITRGQDKVFLKLIPHAKHVTIKGASHFLQETHGPELSENIITFLK